MANSMNRIHYGLFQDDEREALRVQTLAPFVATPEGGLLRLRGSSVLSGKCSGTNYDGPDSFRTWLRLA